MRDEPCCKPQHSDVHGFFQSVRDINSSRISQALKPTFLLSGLRITRCPGYVLSVGLVDFHYFVAQLFDTLFYWLLHEDRLTKAAFVKTKFTTRQGLTMLALVMVGLIAMLLLSIWD
jgi:uncharacterized membrane protein